MTTIFNSEINTAIVSREEIHGTLGKFNSNWKKIVTVYKLSEDIETFPSFMPHLRKSIITKIKDNKRFLKMSAVINGIKSSWESESTSQKNKSIKFSQLRGTCKVMRGEWIFKKGAGGTRITIVHDFDLGWPIIGYLVSRTIVRRWVDKYCQLTLGAIKEKAESLK